MNDATSEDTLLGGRVRLLQPRKGYRAAIDPVFLAAAIPARKGQRILDAGTGVGSAALCLAARVPGLFIDALELQPGLAALAVRNARLNGRDGLRVVVGDIADPPGGLSAGGYDHVMANPPHLPAGHGHPPADETKVIANRETTVDLAGWLDFMIAMARPGGTLTLIHRADRQDELLAGLQGRVGGITVFPLWPKAPSAPGATGQHAKPAKRVLVQGRKGVSGPLTMAAGLVLHADGGAYSAEAEAVLAGGEALTL